MIILVEYFILIGTLRHTQGKRADCKVGFSSRLKCSLVFGSIRIWSQIDPRAWNNTEIVGKSKMALTVGIRGM